MVQITFTPAFLASVATLLTALVTIVKLFRVDEKTDQQSETLVTIKQQTNSQLERLQEQVRLMEAHIKRMEDEGYRFEDRRSSS